MSKKFIHVSMFKSFTIEYEGIVISNEDIKSKQVVRLFGYLLLYSNRVLISEELVDLMWGYQNVDNSMAGLKNLIYRLRMILKTQLHIDDLIITKRKAYSMNPEYTIVIDVFEFEEICSRINEEPENRLLYEELLRIYTGKFLMEIQHDHQMVSKRLKLQEMYANKVFEYARILEKNKEYIELETIIKKAIQLECLDEQAFILLIRSLYFQKKYSIANDTYKQAMEILYHTTNVGPSIKMKALYDMIKKETHDKNTNIIDIHKELVCDKQVGTTVCQYAAFKDFYNLQVRMMGRLGINSQICLLTVNDASRFIADQNTNKIALEKAMKRIQERLIMRLSSGDVVTRINKKQLVILLPTYTYEDSYRRINQVLKYIKSSLQRKSIIIDLSIREIGMKY